MVDALDAKPRGTTQDAQRVPACPVLAIGVTGHRDVRLEGIDIAALVALIDTTLAQIEQTARALTPDVQLRVVTALADGADSLVADAALRRGWSLASVLPFARSTYAADFVT